MEKLMILHLIVDGETYQTVSVEKGEPVLVSPPPEKEGYTFVRWEGLPERGIAGKEVKATAHYTKNEYEVTFKLDGEIVSSEKLPYASVIALPAVSGGADWGEFPKNVPAFDVVIEGRTEPDTYSLTMLVDGEVFGSYNFLAGADLTKLPVPQKAGHDFSGWNKKYKVMPHSNLTIRGSYKPHKHTLSFVIGDEMEFTKQVEFGTPINFFGLPKREDYTFVGWEGVPDTMPDHDLIFEGNFELNKRTLRFVLDGQTIFESRMDVGTPIKPPDTPNREGYMFSGWRGLPKTMPDADYTAEGKYYLRKYKLTFVVDGKAIEKRQVSFGAPVEKAVAPEKVGFRFDGWENMPVSMPAEDVTVVGSYTEL